MNKKPKNNNNEMINFYDMEEVKKLTTKYYNPCFKDHHLQIPFRLAMCGGSGTGKTSVLMNLIAKCYDTFGHIFVVCKAREPLYDFLEKKVGAKQVTILTKLTELPPIKDFPYKDKQILLVFDDMVNEKNQQTIQEFFIRGRKVGCGISICYLSQSFFKIPKLVRLQCNYLILLRLPSLRDLHLILMDYGLGIERNELENIFKDATKKKFNFLKIDLDNPNNNEKFSKNWNDFYKVGNDDYDDEEEK